MTGNGRLGAGSNSIAVVGAGRAGGAIARAAGLASLEVYVFSHELAAAAAASARTVLLCVPDRAIAEMAEVVARSEPLPEYLGHVSGASGLTVLQAAAERGVATFSLHPLQTIPDAASELAGAACAVAGSTEGALDLARSLATRLGMTPFEVRDAHRASYHAAAAFASNFLFALEESAAELLARIGVAEPRAVLAPLVLRTAANWAERGAAGLTGPIARGDAATTARHLEALRAVAPELIPLYQLLAERTARVAAGEGGRNPDGSA